jgi:acetyl-CoA carboxylase biotin carboxyl carrier protein
MTSSSFTNREIDEILSLIDRLDNVEVRLETASIKLHVRKFSGAGSASAPRAVSERPRADAGQSGPVQVSPGAERASPGAGGAEPAAGLLAIRAPMLGRFHRAPSPSEPPFVEVGAWVEPVDPVCMIEVMKLFNTVNAGVSGTIAKISAENATMVEYDQVLFLVTPD